MPFKPGDPKPENSGRKAGAPNRRTQVLKEILEECGIDPARRLAEILPMLEPEREATLLLKLMQFIYPLRKAIETPDNSQQEDAIEQELERVLAESHDGQQQELKDAQVEIASLKIRLSAYER